jgi:hypothetical protein
MTEKSLTKQDFFNIIYDIEKPLIKYGKTIEKQIYSCHQLIMILQNISDKLEVLEVAYARKIPMHKICIKCNQEKSLCNFNIYTVRKKNRSFRTICKSCINLNYKKRVLTEEQRVQRALQKKDYNKKIKAKRGGYNQISHAENKEERLEKNKQYRNNNKEAYAIRDAARYQKCTDRINMVAKKYYMDHPDKRMANVCRMRVKAILDSGREYPDLIGCDSEFLYQWFIFQLKMEPDMTMENRGTYWHIDHVIPCDAWDMTNEEHKHQAFHWTNLAPLEASENQSKSNKIIQSYIDKQNERLVLWGLENEEEYELLKFDQAKPTIAGSTLEPLLPLDDEKSL